MTPLLTGRASTSWERSTIARRGISRRSGGAALSDPLARAVRPGHDRSHGVRNAGSRLPQRLGSEIIEKVTGRIVSSMDEAMLALPEVIALDRRTVRRRFEERFSATRMARDYVNVYRKLLKPSKLVEPQLPGAIDVSCPSALNVAAAGSERRTQDWETC